MHVRAIETVHAGVRFRSRLEARWATFLDALRIPWEYEPETFEVPDWRTGQAAGYLPDFYLPTLGCYVECKGTLDDVSEDYLAMITNAVDWGGCLPGVGDSSGSTRGLMWLFGVPDASTALPAHAILQHRKGGFVNGFAFTSDGGLEVFEDNQTWFTNHDSGDELRVLLRPYERGRYWRERQAPPLLRAAYSQARSARFQQGGWQQ